MIEAVSVHHSSRNPRNIMVLQFFTNSFQWVNDGNIVGAEERR